MRKADKIRKMVTRVSAGVILIALVIFNFQIGLQSNDTSHLSLSDLTLGLYTPAAYAINGSCCPYDGAHCGLNNINYKDEDYHFGSCPPKK